MKKSWTCAAGALLALTLALPQPAEAKKDEPLDFNDPEAVLEFGEAIGVVATPGVNKKTGLPHKVAIGGFQIQFTLRTQTFGDQEAWYLRLSDEDYQRITDAMYDLYVESLVAHGFEVVGKDAVVAAPTYGRLKGEEEARVNDRKVVFPASGMRFLKMAPGGSALVPNLWYLPELNADLGTDSTLLVTGNIALCEVKVKGQPSQAAVCSGPIAEEGKTGINQYSGLTTVWLHGAKEGGKLPGAEHNTWAALGTSIMGKYGFVPLIYSEQAVRQTVRKGLFATSDQVHADAYVDGALSLWDTMLFLTWAQWDEAMKKPIQKLSGG